jgi:hypothetical protein
MEKSNSSLPRLLPRYFDGSLTWRYLFCSEAQHAPVVTQVLVTALPKCVRDQLVAILGQVEEHRGSLSPRGPRYERTGGCNGVRVEMVDEADIVSHGRLSRLRQRQCKIYFQRI